MPGRPFVVEGKFKTTVSKICNTNNGNDTTSWKMGQVPSVLSNVSLNQEIGRRWLDLAEGEHASIASFARHTLQLMSSGAPSMLLDASQKAAIDEVRHAKRCYGFASAFLGSNFGPGQLDVEGSLTKMDAKKITQSIIEEGCIEETISAVEAHVAASTAQDPDVKAALSRIASDETNHAQLAWDTIQWITDNFPETQAFVEETFHSELESRLFAIENELPSLQTTPCLESDADSVFRSYGLTVDGDSNKIHQAAMRDIIKPVYITGLKNVDFISTQISKMKDRFA